MCVQWVIQYHRTPSAIIIGIIRMIYLTYPFFYSLRLTQEKHTHLDHTHSIQLSERKAVINHIHTWLQQILLTPYCSVSSTDYFPYSLRYRRFICCRLIKKQKWMSSIHFIHLQDLANEDVLSMMTSAIFYQKGASRKFFHSFSH